MYWPEGPELALPRAARERGIRVVMEVYVDMDYAPDGSIVIQREKHVTDLDKASAQIRRFLEDGVVLANDGSLIPLEAESICVHGDGPNAARGDRGAAPDDLRLRPHRRAARRRGICALMRFGLMFSHQVPPGRGIGRAPALRGHAAVPAARGGARLRARSSRSRTTSSRTASAPRR